MTHSQRKADHIRINLDEDVQFPRLTTGLEQVRLLHQALPELDLAQVETTTTLFGKRLSAPILVSSMTGGTAHAGNINLALAEAAQFCGLAMGLGSQRAAIEAGGDDITFRVRQVAPDILLFANIGAVQLNYGFGVDDCRRAVEMIQGDGLILHLNPLQEAVQPEGDGNWRDLLVKIEAVCTALSVPVIAKEVGWGISTQTARRLIEAGISAIDVAGAGGTSWSEVESHRAPTARMRRVARTFADWGIPTAESLTRVRQLCQSMDRADLPLFASGGIRDGIDITKCLALGADLVGLAAPFLRQAVESVEAVVEEMQSLQDEMRIAMFCCGRGTIVDLQQPGVIG